MDQMTVTPASCNPELLRVLKDYKSAAEASLKGPSRYMEMWGHNLKQSSATAEETLQEFRKAMMSVSLEKKPSAPDCDRMTVGDSLGSFYNHTSGGFPGGVPNLPMGPLLIPMDNSHSEKSDTTLENITIACFVVGGEKRLCLPQILNTVLQDFDLRQINDMCDKLHIFCSRCNPQQLERLKLTAVLPPSAPSCGLITKTDAERLCNALLHGSPEKSKEPSTPNSFKVYHECFGKCKGVLNPELYVEPEAKCIECCHCHGMFSPQKFVVHSDKALENRTCHWGFDSGNWRSYILLAKDQDSRETMQPALEDIKDKFDVVAGFKKRRDRSVKHDDLDNKRARYDETKEFDPNSPWAAEYVRQVSAFRPWSPSLATLLREGKLPALTSRDGVNNLLPSYLQSGPPVLLNPERVVPFTDTKRYDRHFAPNVSLAPQLCKEENKEGIELESPIKIDPKLLSTSSYSSSTLSSPSPIKTERNLELDLSSSDESSFRSESMPVTPRDDYHSVLENGLPTDMEMVGDQDRLLGLVRQALDTSPDAKSKERELILEHVIEVCGRQNDRTRLLLQNRKLLNMECEKLRVSKRERLQEMSESRHMLRLQVERLQQELQATNKLRMSQETQIVKNADVSRIKAKYKGQIEVLRGRVGEYERLNGSLANEVTSLHHQLKLLSRDTHNNHLVAAPVTKSRHNGDLLPDDDVDITMEPTTDRRENTTLKAVLNGQHPEMVKVLKVNTKSGPPSTEQMDT